MSDAEGAAPHRSPGIALALLAAWIGACTLYANASFLVESPDALRFFPPYVAGLDANANRHLGAEYWNIARALAAGRGFADPFFVESGPTAWMPPVYPFLLAALLRATGSETAVVAIVVAAKGVVLVWTGLLIFHGARRHARRVRPELALLAYAVWITAHFDWFFQITHDVWLLLALVDALLSGAWRWLDRGVSGLGAVAWGVLGGVTALASPILGVAWGGLGLFLGSLRGPWRLVLGSIAVAALVISPWVARNAAVFGEPFLVKSNLAYDLYQANYVSRHGVYDEPFLLRHPVWTTMRAPASVYRTRGEAAFLDSYRARLRDAFADDPAAVLRGAAQRALAATLVYRPYRPRIEGRHPPVRTALHPLPVLGLVAIALARRSRPPAEMAVAVLLYAAALTPYVVVAFYLRYLLPLTPLLVLFAFWGIEAVASRLASADPRT